MNSKKHPPEAKQPIWSWPVDVKKYDRQHTLSTAEAAVLRKYVRSYDGSTHEKPSEFHHILHRLLCPLEDVLDYTIAPDKHRGFLLLYLLREMSGRRRSFWGWTEKEWVNTINQRKQQQHYVIAISYLLCNFNRLDEIGGAHLVYTLLARKIFGQRYIDAAMKSVCTVMSTWGYTEKYMKEYMQRTVCEAMLFNRSPLLEDITLDFLKSIRQKRTNKHPAKCLVALSNALTGLGVIDTPLSIWKPITEKVGYQSLIEKVPQEWVRLTQHWFKTSTRTRAARRRTYYLLLNVGRWLAHTIPEIKSPDQWTRDTAAQCVAMIMNMKSGDWIARSDCCNQPEGKLLAPTTRAGRLSDLRIFFHDLQEWGVIARRFDPHHCFTVPKTLRALVTPNPRVIADDVWAKLVWAGLNISVNDLPGMGGHKEKVKHPWYPIELVRALVMTWLFAGLRVNEIMRLRVGCIRWQEEALIPGTTDVLAKNAVCFLDVPVNKTGAAFSKPVDRAVGEAITAWEKVRPTQPQSIDPKTGELIDRLFRYRRMGVGQYYVNSVLIPILCGKAGVSRVDVRGNITSHRARSTIASQLYNSKEPMTLFELQEWLGHSSPSATQHYARITPTKLAKSYSDAGYFERNIRRINVLIDQERVRSGAAANGETWKYYDLGHGYCAYDFFDQCPHRMACAKCKFYLPKSSTKAQLMEGQVNLLRMMQEIPLSDEEKHAVEDGIKALTELTNRLTNVPTPDGRTPQQIIEIRGLRDKK
ncbi:MAG: tyrosine-type recombinase/integrase [Blastocatellia bacterium]